jgi:hypothetical protein
MRVDTRPRKRNAPRIAEKSAPGFLQWLRGRECFCSTIKDATVWCEGRLEAAHVDHAGGKGMGTKVRDSAAIPLCSKHHRIQHKDGWLTFQTVYGFDAVAVAELYWRAWPGRPAWERKLSDG